MKTYLDKDSVEKAYGLAKAQYAKLGVNTDKAMASATRANSS